MDAYEFMKSHQAYFEDFVRRPNPLTTVVKGGLSFKKQSTDPRGK